MSLLEAIKATEFASMRPRPVNVTTPGRTLMPKADLPLVIYDETKGQGFVRRLQVG
jgi:hypothetical protein